MDTKTRIKLISLLKKINNQPEYSKKLGIEITTKGGNSNVRNNC